MWKKIRYNLLLLIESFLRPISGGLGRRIRYFYYKNRFKSCGINVLIDEGVIFRNPENIVLGNNVWINSFSILTAKPSFETFSNRILIEKENLNFNHKIGEIIIGNNTGIGSFSVLQGYGGIKIEDNVTLSDYIKIFSFSHYPNNPKNKKEITYSSSVNEGKKVVCILSPIVIKKGTWLALNTSVFKGTIGANSFVTINSVVINDLPENSYASGNPAKKIKNRFDYETE